MSLVIQALRKICCTFTAAYVRGPAFILAADLPTETQMAADLASETQMVRLFHCRGDGLSLPCKRHFPANVTKVIYSYTVTRHD